MFSVYRGTLPYGQQHLHCFDAMMLGIALDSGAELIGSRVNSACYNADGSLQLGYLAHGVEAQLTADFAVFAGGVNVKPDKAGAGLSLMDVFRQLQPDYVPPQLRKCRPVFRPPAKPAGNQGFPGPATNLQGTAAPYATHHTLYLQPAHGGWYFDQTVRPAHCRSGGHGHFSAVQGRHIISA